MLLSGQTIRERGIITPFSERTVGDGMTFGLGPAGYDVRINENIYLQPGTFALASTIEHFSMPIDILGTVHNKSTLIRKGIDAAHSTVIEPGWRGFLTLEIHNKSALPVQLYYGMPIAQILFWHTDKPCQHPYDGKYQDQEPGAQPARFEGMVIK